MRYGDLTLVRDLDVNDYIRHPRKHNRIMKVVRQEETMAYIRRVDGTGKTDYILGDIQVLKVNDSSTKDWDDIAQRAGE